MAVEFISYGYDTAPGTGLGELVWQEMHPQIGAATYGVRSPTDWKVTAVSGADRTVSIAAGRGWGLGVIDKTVTNDTIQLDPIVSGSRWDLIVCRRDPTPTGGESKFMKINGGATPVIPGARLSGPGIHDQPLALVQVTAGTTQPTAIIDIRCWAANGGMVAADDLARSYLNQLGTAVWIDDLLWRYQPGLNDIPEWVTGGAKEFSPLTVAGYSLTGKVDMQSAGQTKTRVTVDINVTRTGAAGAIPKDDWASFGAVIPDIARGNANPKYVPVAVIGGTTSTATTNAHATVFLNPSNGVMQIRGLSTFTWNPGALFSLNLSYLID